MRKVFIFINPFRTRFPLKIFLVKYVRILVKSVQLGYSPGNTSDLLGIYQRIKRRKGRILGTRKDADHF